MWGATSHSLETILHYIISIHAPRVGRDPGSRRAAYLKGISIHAPRVGRDAAVITNIIDTVDFNPRAPCGARRRHRVGKRPERDISIHAPRVGRDVTDISAGKARSHFNPRAPCGARHTSSCRFPSSSHNFNPRAPCGARRLMLSNVVVWWYFNPRAPCGARPGIMVSYRPKLRFQSTRPVWGATKAARQYPFPFIISIHAPRVGRDLLIFTPFFDIFYFNPRAPCGARLESQTFSVSHGAISIHAPRVGRDWR